MRYLSFDRNNDYRKNLLFCYLLESKLDREFFFLGLTVEHHSVFKYVVNTSHFLLYCLLFWICFTLDSFFFFPVQRAFFFCGILYDFQPVFDSGRNDFFFFSSSVSAFFFFNLGKGKEHCDCDREVYVFNSVSESLIHLPPSPFLLLRYCSLHTHKQTHTHTKERESDIC